MTGKQKAIVAVLIIADVVVILGLVLVMTRSRPTSPPSVPLPPDCRWEAVRLMSQAGLGGTVEASEGVLRFDMTVPLAPTEDVTAGVDLAAQAVWPAFDIAASLWRQEKCAVFGAVDVGITVVDGAREVGRIAARVDLAPLVAFERGALTEEEFIEQVSYSASVE